ncbi:MAG: carboxylating nicotinate-nucleotide diphosphorylase [Candidatus Omnitrophica bacterium]|nr:carboxylating nicotinate-nucleotide diphosphorylase [Candidatus Omnitrophota bacterium]
MALDKHFLSERAPKLDQEKLDYIVRHALIEDIGRGDITTQLTIPKDKTITAHILLKEKAVVCGMDVAKHVFKAVDSSIIFKGLVEDGKEVKPIKTIARISGKATSILSSERVALNLLSLLSGIATKTKEYVEHIEPYKAKITDTRKTLPGLRDLQKYAVRVGGGHNHRMGLDEMILIKDNHIKVTEGYEKLPSIPKGYKIEVEVQNLDEFKHALYFKPDVIMLDNMSLEDMKEAVKIRNNTEFKSHHPPTMLEASGGVDFNSVRKIASLGIDIISIGELTNSVKGVDMSLEVV